MSTDETPGQATSQATAGWYPDPWFRGQRRYWDGHAWTAHAFPEDAVPGGPGQPGSGYRTSTPLPPPTIGVPGGGPPPPEWWAPVAEPEATPPAGVAAPSGTGRSNWPPRGRTLVAMLLVLGFIVGLIGGGLLTNRRSTPTASPTPAATTLPTPGPGSPRPIPSGDPAASVLSGLVLRQSDVGLTETVNPISGGTQVTGEPTLDLCNGTFPSESLRTARLQVAGVDNQGTLQLSTEAVLYSTPAGGAQAFSELTSTAAGCPASPVISPVGEPTVTTQINSPPDASWPQAATVERLAYDFVTTDPLGQKDHITAVYLRRGRALMGIYFSQPDGPQAPVDGQTTMAGIVNIFGGRMANLSASTVNG